MEIFAYLCKMIGIKASEVDTYVLRHYDVTGKTCPGIIGWNEEVIYDVNTGKATSKRSTNDKWIEFKNRLK